jgi:hypothetical protein
MADSMPSELDQLRRENARLIALLEAHGVAWRSSGPAPTEPAPISVHPSAHAPLSPEEKVALFRRLFRGRDDVYALRWQSNSPRFQESCHPSHQYTRGLEVMTNASLQRGRQG